MLCTYLSALKNNRMKKIVSLLLPLCIIFAGCTKNIKRRLYYSVSTYPDSTLDNVYITDSGTYTMPIQVKFLSGNIIDGVSLSLSGLPANVTVTPDSFSALPSYTQNFVFTANYARQGTYPITLTAYTQTAGYQKFTFNLTVVPIDAASLFWSHLSGANACTARNYTFNATGSSSGTVNNLVINNFGGYGQSVNVNVIFNVDNGTLSIPAGNYGNGTVLSGSGTFTTTAMTINYTATSTPAGNAETCTETFTIN
jgi:hypothetical protein